MGSDLQTQQKPLGLHIVAIQPDSAAQKVGLMPWFDYITHIGAKNIASIDLKQLQGVQELIVYSSKTLTYRRI